MTNKQCKKEGKETEARSTHTMSRVMTVGLGIKTFAFKFVPSDSGVTKTSRSVVWVPLRPLKPVKDI